MYCPICQNSEVPDGAANCSSCGAELTAFHQISLVQKQRTYYKILSVAFGSLIIIGIISSIAPYNNEDSSKLSESQIANEEGKKHDESNVIPWSDSLAARDAKIAELVGEVNNLRNASKTPEVAEPSTGTVTHIVKNGESLWTIAEKYFGDGNEHVRIAKQNNLSDVNLIQVGEPLIIQLNK